MTFEQDAKAYLSNNGMFEKQANAVIDLMKQDDEQNAMTNRWSDDVSGYPDNIANTFHVLVSGYAVKWIDANAPKAWYRPMFAGEV